MRQLGSPDVDFPASLLNDNQGSIYWIKSGCNSTEKIQHKNLLELGNEARKYKEVERYWTPRPTNLADIFTKEDKDVAYFESVRDKMVVPQESFCLLIKANSWGMLERRLDDLNYEILTKST